MDEQNNPQVTEVKPKAYDPGWYLLVGIIFSLIPVFIMSFHNAKIFPNGEEIRSRMKVYLWVYITIILGNIVSWFWAYYTFYKWLLTENLSLLISMSYYDNPLQSIGVKSVIREAALNDSSLSLAVKIINNGNTYIVGLSLLLLLAVLHFTRKNEVPTFKELRAGQQIDRKNPIIAILIGLVISAVIFLSASYAVSPVTRLLLKSSATETAEEVVVTDTQERKLPGIPTIPKEEVSSETTETQTETFEDKYSFVGDFMEGLARAGDADGNEFHIDEQGNPIYEERYKIAYDFHEGRAAVRDQNDNWFHIDTTGERVYSENYKSVSQYDMSRSLVKDFNGNEFHIDLNGDRPYEMNWKSASRYTDDGKAHVTDFTGNGFWIDLDGNVVTSVTPNKVPVTKEEAEALTIISESYPYRELGDGVFIVRDNNNDWYHIDMDGSRIYEQNYTFAQKFSEGRAAVTDKENNSFHIVKTGQRIYEENYAKTWTYENGRAKVNDKDGNEFYIDLEGNKI